MDKVNCFYHQNCLDGIVAAVNVYGQIGDGVGVFTPIQYGQDLTTMSNLFDSKVALFVDYCPNKEQFEWLVKNKPELQIWILDHHKTAWDLIPQYVDKLDIRYCLHKNMSGAGLAKTVNISSFATKIAQIPTINSLSNIRVDTLQSSYDPLTYLTQFRDLWTDPNSPQHEEACCLHDAVDLYGIKHVSVLEAVEFFASHPVPELIEMGKLLRSRNKDNARILIKHGKVLNCKDSNGKNFELLVTIASGNMGTIVGEVFNGSTMNPNDLPRVSIVINISLENNDWVLSARSSTTADALSVIKALCKDNGGGHIRACGGRIDHANDLPLDLFLEELPGIVSKVPVVL